MNEFVAYFSGSLPRTLTSLIDILAVAFLLYQFFMIVRGRRAVSIIVGIVALVGVYVLAVLTGLELLRTLLQTLAPYTAFALIVMFQSDIRRLLARLGRRRWFTGAAGLTRHELAGELALTLSHLAQQKIGALIVLERDIGLRTFIESGVRVDGEISRDLLLAIFEPNGALHDGAVIIQSGRIAAAACFLPLTLNPRLSSTLGTRHRAAIGVTEETDCLALVVSEETGHLSFARSGDITLDVSQQALEEAIAGHFAGKSRATGAQGEPGAMSSTSHLGEAGRP